MRYTVLVHKGESPNEVMYGAEVVELPGCFSAGDSMEELEANVREAIELYREGEGGKYPAPTSLLFQLEVSV